MQAPNELVMMGASVGLESAGVPITVFNPAAPLAACRLCGAILQTDLHRQLYNEWQLGINDSELVGRVLDIGMKWREKHTKRKHTLKEVEQFSKTGWALTPQAANVLSPFGIIPLGRMSQDLNDSMFEAARAPDLTYLEGGE